MKNKDYLPEILITLLFAAIIASGLMPESGLQTFLNRLWYAVLVIYVGYSAFALFGKFAERYKLSYYFFAVSLFCMIAVMAHVLKPLP